MSIRKTVVAGSFYPNDKNELYESIKYFDSLDKRNINNTDKLEDIRAIISPHAGYIYSGFTANLAYKKAAVMKAKRVIVIGPSHHVYLKGASVALYDEYETPLGNINIDLDFSKDLIKEYDFLDFNVECEFEHSSETQAPFIKHYFSNSKIIEIVYGDCEHKDLVSLISKLLSNKDNFIVISTDLSHFYNLEEAKKLDSICLEAIKTKDIRLLDSCEACGKTGVKAILDIANKENMKTKILDYCTSEKVTNNESKVVGYTSALIGY